MIDAGNSIAYFRPVGSAADGAAMASASAGSGGGCGCDSGGGDGGAAGAAAGGSAGVLQAPAGALTQQHTPASPDALVSYTFDLLVAADGAGSMVRKVLERHDAGLRVGVTRDVMEFRICVLGAADQFLSPGVGAVGTFQTWTNPKVCGRREEAGG